MQKFDHLGTKILTPIDNGGEVPKLGMFLTSAGNIGFAINGTQVFEMNADGSFTPGNISALVELLQAYYAVLAPAPQVIISGTTHPMAQSQFEIQLNKTVSSNSIVILPNNPIAGQIARVSDGKGDLSQGGFTITVEGKNGATINGQATHVIDYAWGCATYRWDSTQWNIVGLV